MNDKERTELAELLAENQLLTHGVDPSMLEVALIEDGGSLPQQLHDDYQRAYAEHRATGKRGLVREIIVAKTADSSSSNAKGSRAEERE